MKLFFKFKIAMISFAVSGILLIAFGFIFFAFVYRTGIERMDRELRALVETSLRGGHPESYWRALGNSVKFIHDESGTERIALLVMDPAGRTLYRSDNAHPNLARLTLPEPPDPVPADGRPNEDMFMRRNDGNKDNRVSRQEFDGPAHLFSKADKNGDGYIDNNEAQHVPLPRRPGQQSRPQSERLGPQRASAADPLPSVSDFQTVYSVITNWRIGIFRTPEITVIAALNMNSFYQEINQIRTVFMIAVPTGLLILGFLGWFLADRAMKPVAIIAQTAESITAKGLDKRIPKVGNDIELERLVDVANNMLGRLEKSYHQAVRFSADAAHELQTPLTILQGELDNAIQSSDDGSEEQQRYSMLLEETRNLKTVVQKLLLLAHADEGRLNINPQPVNISELIDNAAEDIEFMAPELSVKLKVQKDVIASADAALLNQVIRNMTSNAAKYAPEDGTAHFELKTTANSVLFTLSNTALPIPDEDRALLFERFHRVEKSRTAAGSGLGLSLAREIARAHGGDLVLNPYAENRVSFTLSLPT